MELKKIIKIDLYDSRVVFVITDEVNKTIAKISKRHNLDFSIDYDIEGIVFNADIKDYFLLINLKYLTHNTIAHEVYHAVVNMTEARNITDEESQAWLCGKLTEKVYKFINSKGLTVG